MSHADVSLLRAFENVARQIDSMKRLAASGTMLSTPHDVFVRLLRQSLQTESTSAVPAVNRAFQAAYLAAFGHAE